MKTIIADAESISTYRKGGRWTGGVIGLLIGLATVCHGCHGGDRDDELSLTSKTRVENRQDVADIKPEVQVKAHQP